MSTDKQARIKAIFFKAIDTPESQRQAYVEMACEGDDSVLKEVMSLLRHHRRDATLIREINPISRSASDARISTESRFNAGARTRVGDNHAHLEKTISDPLDTKIVLSELWNESRELLQTRLRIFATILALIIGYSILRKLFHDPSPFDLAVRISCFAVDSVCLAFLGRWRRTTLTQMRLLEAVITCNVGLLMVVLDIAEIQLLSGRGDADTLKSASLWTYMTWSLFILVYGIYIPNTWQRAAMLLLPTATIPYLIDFGTQRLHPIVADYLMLDKFGLPLPLPFIAAGVAISSASVIHGARLAAFRARRLAQYELLQEIGTGGMGKVYAARHVMLKRPCAIKVIQPEKSQDPHVLQNFEREAYATSRLTHPNTIEVFDFGQTNEGLFFYVMELLPGANLRDLVKQTGPIPPSRTIYLLLQICGALQEAHEMGLIHRDIKPANIFASQRGGLWDFAKLLDFGLVRQIEGDATSNERPGRFTAGSPEYMSPEQIRDYANIDFRSDIYSLGAVAYFMLVGQPPFRRRGHIELFLAHINEPVIAPHTLNPGISHDLNSIIVKCLEKHPENRFSTAKELKTALSALPEANNWNQEQAVQWWRNQKIVAQS